MDDVRKSTNRISESSFQAITQFENVLQELNGAIHKKRSPKKGLVSQFKRQKLDDYRRSIIDRALQDRSPVNRSIKKTTSTPIPKSFNNQKYHLTDNRNSSLLISPIAKTSSMSSSSPYDNILLEDTSKSKSEIKPKSNQNSKRSALNGIVASQLQDEQTINRNKSTSKSNKSNKLQNEEHNVQQLNKSANNSKFNNKRKTCNNDELSTSARADVEQFLKDLDNCTLRINNDSMMNTTSSILFKQPWRINEFFAMSAKTFDSLERNPTLVEDLDKKLPKKCQTNTKRFVNNKSLSAMNKNTQQLSVDCNEQNQTDDNDLDKSDSDITQSDLECVMAFLSSVVKPTVPLSVRFCDDDDVGENVNNRKTTKKVLKNNNKKSSSKAITLQQNTFQKLNELHISTGLEHCDDSEDEIVYAHRAKRSKTTQQASTKAKKPTLNNNNNNNNNVNKRSRSLITETSCSNTNQTQETQAGIRRSSRARKLVPFKGTVIMTDSVKVYEKINETAAQSGKKRKTI